MTNESTELATLPPHAFLADDEISLTDVVRIIQLTSAGLLRWQPSTGLPAFWATPVVSEANDSREVSEAAIGSNLRGIRFGSDSAASRWFYFRLEAHDGQEYYVEGDSSTEVSEACDILFELVQRSQRFAGVIGGPMEHCEACDEDKPHAYLVNLAHGIPGTEMGGSRRKVCTACEHVTFLDR